MLGVENLDSIRALASWPLSPPYISPYNTPFHPLIKKIFYKAPYFYILSDAPLMGIRDSMVLLEILEWSEPQNPSLIQTFIVSEGQGTEVADSDTLQDFLYIINSNYYDTLPLPVINFLKICDISDPFNPSIAGEFIIYLPDIPYYISVEDTFVYLYVHNAGVPPESTFAGLWILNAKDPANITLLKKYNFYPIGVYDCYNILAKDSLLFMSIYNGETHRDEVWILDVKDPFNIIPLSVIPDAKGFLLYKQPFLFIGKPLTAYDITNPLYPQKVAQLPFTAGEIYLTNDTLYTQMNGVCIFKFVPLSISEGGINYPDLTVYPIIFNKGVWINSGIYCVFKYEIFDITGRKILKGQGRNKVFISSSNLGKPGVYFLKIKGKK